MDTGRPEMNDYDVVVIGGGPAGLYTAGVTGKGRLKVLVLEKKAGCGRKLLITGTGQCNLTHEGEIRSFLSHYGEHGAFLRPALMNLTNTGLMAFFEERGLPLIRGKGGKIFPASMKASDVLQVLIGECNKNGVAFRCNEPVLGVEQSGETYGVTTTGGRYSARFLVIATGGASYPATGSTGDGYRLASSLGHTIVEPAPALCAVSTDPCPFRDLSGISFDNVEIILAREDKPVRKHRGDILLTHEGLSGPGILDLSRYVRAGDQLRISFISPSMQDEITRALIDEGGSGSPRQVRTVLSGLGLPDRFIKRQLELTGVPDGLSCAHLSRSRRSSLITNLTAFRFNVRGMGGYNEAMVTRGGVSLDEVSPKTMESKRCRHLYFVGEVLDIDGDTGGYNLQAAFSCGALAGRHILSECSSRMTGKPFS
jgi:predicted Rossmann fold flavoprotein